MRNAVVAVSILLVGLMAACVAGRPEIEPITRATDAVPAYGKFVWRDLLTEDVAAVKKFYGELLGWKFAGTQAPNYTLIEYDGRSFYIVGTAHECLSLFTCKQDMCIYAPLIGFSCRCGITS